MKQELIKTENYLLVVDDSEIKEGDLYVSPNEIVIFEYSKETQHNGVNQVPDGCKKIIAHLPLNNFPILKGVNLLPSFA